MKYTLKVFKIQTVKINTRKCRINGTVGFYNSTIDSNDAHGIPNSVDPDLEQSDLG